MGCDIINATCGGLAFISFPPQGIAGKASGKRDNMMRITSMLNKAVRMHGQNDLRLDTFELPEIKDDEILVKVISDSICMSSYKAAIQGSYHKRVPEDIAEHPVIIGHEFCGIIEEVGAKWADKLTAGEKLTIQPNISYRGTMQTPGYAFEFCGGDTQ